MKISEKYSQEIVELSSNAEELKLFVEKMPVGFFIHHGGVFIYVNTALEKIGGYSKEEFYKKKFWSIVYHKDRKKIKERGLERLKKLNGAPPPRYEFRVITQNGDIKWVDMKVSTMMFKGKRVVFGIVMDITQEKKFAEVLHATELLMQKISNNLESAMIYQIVVSKNGKRRLAYVSDSVRKFYGITPEQAKKNINLVYDKVHKEDIEDLHREELKALANFVPFKKEARVVGPNRKIRWSYFVSVPSKLSDGSICWDGIEFDITKQKNSEETLKEINSQLASIIDFFPDATLVVNKDKKLVGWNKAMEEMTGVKKEQILGKDHSYASIPFYGERREYLLDFLYKKERDKGLKLKYKNIVEKGKCLYAEAFAPFVHKHKGAYLWVAASLILDTKGKVIGGIESIRDVTDRRNTEEMLVESKKRYEIATRVTGQIFYEYFIKTGEIKWFGPVKEITGYTNSYFKNVDIKKWTQLIHPNDRKRASLELQKAQNKNSSYSCQYLFHKNGDGYITVLDEGSFFRDKNTGEVRMLGSMRDISDRVKAEEKLKNSEEKFRKIFDNTNDAIYIHDPSGIVLGVNQVAGKMLGYSKKELMTMSPAKIDAPEEARNVPARVKRVVTDGSYLFESVHLTKQGKRIPVEVNAKLIEYDGKMAIISAVRDITRRKKVEEELRESEQKYSSLFTNMADGFALHKVIVNKFGKPVDYEFLEVNPAFEQLTGLKSKDILGKRISRVILGIKKDPAMWIEKYGKVALSNKSIRFENYSVPLKKWFSISAYSYKKGYFVTIFEDITNRKNYENVLIEEEKKYQDITEQINEGIGIFVNHKLVWINKALSNIFGFKKEKMLGLSPKDFVIDEYKESVKNIMLEYEKGKKIPSKINVKSINSKGEKIDLSVQLKYINFNNEKAVQVIVRDITETQKIDKAKTEFVSLASHQLRTPLTAVSWNAENILANKNFDSVDENIKIAVDNIYKSNRRMIDLINALLNVSRLELGTFMIEPKKINLNRVIKNITKDVSGMIQKNHLDLKVKFANDVPATFNYDPSLIGIIIQNLLSNSIKYTPPFGKIKLEIKKAGNEILFKVSDTGYGIPENQKDRIFEKLFRADNVKEKDTDGTGLGLYIIKMVIEEIGGKISFESKENVGTTFCVFLPIKGMKRKKGTKNLI